MTSSREPDTHRRSLLGVLGASAGHALAVAQQPLKVAFVYVGPVGEAGWRFAHDAARQAIERSFGAQIGVTAVSSVQEGAVPERVPAAARSRVDAARSGLREGSFAIWKGPLEDNGGRQVLAAGRTGDDAFLRRMDFYVKGVEGRVPS